MSRDSCVCLILFVLIFLLMTCTSRWIPLCWDEGDARFRAGKIAQWVADGESQTLSGQLSRETMADKWRFINYKEGHPAFYAIVAAASQYGLPALWGGASGSGDARTGFLLFYSLAVAAVYYRVRKMVPDSPLSAWFACFSLVFMPRLFCLAHFSVNDSILVSCWLLAWATFDDSGEASNRRWFVPAIWGAFLGLACASKFTGLCAIPCFLLAGYLRPTRETARYLFRGLATAAIVFFLVNPPLWVDPVGGLAEFFSRNLGRENTYNLTGYFFGHRYNMTYGLPFWNTVVWVLITIPVGILVCLGFGLNQLWRDRNRLYAPILAANAGVLLLVRALPHAPTHDNDRLFIAAFAFLAIISGLGAGAFWKNRSFDRVWNRSGRSNPGWITGIVLTGIVLGSVSSWLIYAPSWLSYYNLAIGGLPGAYAAGMEPTYWWTDLDDETLNWLNDNTPIGQKVRFNACSYYNMNLLVKQGKLKRNYYPNYPGRVCWYVCQNRPSVFRESDWERLANQTPAYVKSIPFDGWGPWNLRSVPLILVYPADEQP